MEDIWNELKKFYGYCKSKNLILEKIRCGAIKLHNCRDLMEYSRILQDEKEQLLFSNFLASQFCTSKLPLKKKNLNNEGKVKEENNPYLSNINLKVILREKSNFISIKPASNNYILDTALSVKDIYNSIIKIKMNKLNDTEVDQNYSDQLMFILKNFQKKHKKYSYNFHLNNILKKNSANGYYGTLKQSWQQIDEIEIDIKKIIYFFNNILNKVVPLELFGSHKNIQIIRKLIYNITVNKKVFINVLENKWFSPKSKFRLFLKHSGLRLIAKTSYTSKEDHMTMLLKFLRQLCITHYGLASMLQFRDKYKAIVYRRNNYNCNKMWLVSCDIDDSFNKLNNIIKLLCENLSNKLDLKWMALFPVKSKIGNLRFEQYFVDLYVALSIGTIHAPTTITMSKTHITYIMKQNLLDDINKCIFGQKMEIRTRKYLLNKGILQDMILSNIFSNTYYNYIYYQRLFEFMQSGILFRYIDDTLYLSENREFAENLESLPYFKDTHPSHLFTLVMKNKKCEDAIMMFKQRIIYYSYLRLSKIILHDPTNCIHHLKIFVKKISIMQAWRALMFIQKLFGDTHKLYTNHQKIFLTIKISNRKIVRAVLNHCMEDTQNNINFNEDKMRQKMFISLWTAYKGIFPNDTVI
ncbi:telomerase reverse transcriptase-like isoform X1 [Vespula squamosa]|uniref:Telomerase reverse transcriptase n=1 Tax=Vespula squamosa TaxID=30214 RepID=A0ABD1ZWN2_VESSQ